jgi:hypothetical protein
VRAGGVVRVRLLSEREHASLFREAAVRHGDAQVARVDEDDGEENRGGMPDRWFEVAAGGARLNAFLHAKRTRSLLRRLTGLDWTPSGAEGSYSYYRRQGHYLGLHRDVEECDLTVITCIHDSRASADAGTDGVLILYPTRVREPLSSIRTDPQSGAVRVRVAPRESLVFLGGLIPHRLYPVGRGQVRIVAPLCYQVAA